MINKSNIAVLAALALTSVASPALAQSAWTTGTASSRARAGYSLPYGSGMYDNRESSGLRAYGMVQRPGGASRYSPSASGGGSRGYNWALENDN
jgi:hypothetical protein